MVVICNICQEEPEVPHTFEQHRQNCNCIYCYVCISKYLRSYDSCPSCGFRPVSRFNLLIVETNSCNHSFEQDCLECKKKLENKANFNKETPDISKNISYSLAKKEENVKKILKKYKIRLDGSKTVIENRFYDLVDLLHIQKYRSKALSDIEIAWRINRQNFNRKKRKIDSEIVTNLIEIKKIINERTKDMKKS